VRIGSGADLDIVFHDRPSLPKRQRARDHLGSEQLALGEVGLNADDLGDEDARAPGLVRLDDDLAAVGECNAGDAADARLIEQPTGDARPEMAMAECVHRRSDAVRILARKDRLLDEGRRAVPFAQMRGNDRSEVCDAVCHAVTMAREGRSRNIAAAPPPTGNQPIEVRSNRA
jgi:hypothetical protein